MISRNDVCEALAVCSAYDSQHTPVPSEQVVVAWLQHFGQFRHVNRIHLEKAVLEYYNSPHDRLIQPVDLSSIARKYSREDIERSELDSIERRRLEAVCDAKAAPELDSKAAVRQQAIESYSRRFGIGTAEAAVRMDPHRDAANEVDGRAVLVAHRRMSAPPAPLACPDCHSFDVPCTCDGSAE